MTSLKERDEDYKKSIRNSASNIDDLKNNIIDLAKAQLQAENERNFCNRFKTFCYALDTSYFITTI